MNYRVVPPWVPKKYALPWMVIGEGPGKTEVAKGVPFVGRSGQLLRSVFTQLGVELDRCYVTNVVQFRSHDGNPTPEEVVESRPRLLKEIEDYQPERILALGNIAYTSLFPIKGLTIQKDAGRWITYKGGIQVLPCVHPAAVLYAPDLFREFSETVESFFRGLVEFRRPNVIVPQTIEEVHKCLADLKSKDEWGSLRSIDIETSSLEVGGDVLCISVSPSPNVSYVFKEIWLGFMPIRKSFQALFDTRGLTWVGHNVTGFDEDYLECALGLKLRCNYDTLFMHYCIDERHGTHGLKPLSRRYLGAPEYELKFDRDHKSLRDYPEDRVLEYCGFDTACNYRLYKYLAPRFRQECSSWLLTQVLQPTSRILRQVEKVGCLIDKEYLSNLGSYMGEEIEALTDELRAKIKSKTFNPNSPKQVAELLFDRLALPAPTGKLADPIHTGGAKGGRSTSAGVLDELESMDRTGSVTRIKRIRQLQKIKGTYVDGILSRLGDDDRIRTSFILHGTDTGRGSSADPNLQNIPKLFGMEIRDAFIAPKGYLLGEADFSQLEMRTAAYLSRDPELCAALAPGKDIHMEVAVKLYQKPKEQITVQERTLAKYINFGVLYGRTAEAVAEQIIASRPNNPPSKADALQEGHETVKTFWAHFHYLYEWTERIRSDVRQKGEVVTPTGRKRRFPCLLPQTINEILRSAVNFPIQSLAADICFSGLRRVYAALPSCARMLLTVHDSILFEVREGCEEELGRLCKDLMQNPNEDLHLDGTIIAWPIDFATGARWGGMAK